MKKICIVSPSNKFYGSEQVLFDFLKTTNNIYDVYVMEGKFYDILIQHSKHRIHTFTNVKILYAKLAWLLLLNVYDGIYINEGGHSRFITLLSKLFPHKKFFIHIRLLEDTKLSRLGTGRKNIEYIAISNYIANEVLKNTGIKCHTIYDLYVPTQDPKFHKVCFVDAIKAGIVGRVTDTKGLPDIIRFCDYVESLPTIERKIELHFFGSVNENSPLVSEFTQKASGFKHIKCVFHGFVDNKCEIYRGGVDNLLHFNKIEPLGRIYFEAIDFGIPIVGFSSGGIGEIARLLKMSKFVIDSDGDSWEKELFSCLCQLPDNWNPSKFNQARILMDEVFSPNIYTVSLEELFL